MKSVRIKRPFRYDVPGRPGVRRELPAGWAGELPDDIAAAAEAEGAEVVGGSADGAKSKKARKGRRAQSAANAGAGNTAGAGDGAGEGSGGSAGDGEGQVGDGAGDGSQA